MIYDEVLKTKRVADVELHFKSGEVRQGIFYVNIRQRPIEVLNDERKFIPFRTEDGDVLIINKDTIALVRPLGNSRLESMETAGDSVAASTSVADIDDVTVEF